MKKSNLGLFNKDYKKMFKKESVVQNSDTEYTSKEQFIQDLLGPMEDVFKGKKYIECDGVIIDTKTHLLEEYYQAKRQNFGLSKLAYLQALDWALYLRKVDIINDAIKVLKGFDYQNVDILTKVHSLAEAKAKINYLRKQGLQNNIIVVPYDVKKSQMVNARGNILVDDSSKNLDDWFANEGIPISFGEEESNYHHIKNLEQILDDSTLIRVLTKK